LLQTNEGGQAHAAANAASPSRDAEFAIIVLFALDDGFVVQASE
jgi:hypothetical protein